MKQSITIKDDKGKERTFSRLDELVQFLDSFKMSFLPDRFTYKINKEKKNCVKAFSCAKIVTKNYNYVTDSCLVILFFCWSCSLIFFGKLTHNSFAKIILLYSFYIVRALKRNSAKSVIRTSPEMWTIENTKL